MEKYRPIVWNGKISRIKGLLGPRSLKLRQNASNLTHFGRNRGFGAHCMPSSLATMEGPYVKLTIVYQTIINLKKFAEYRVL